MPSPIRKNSGYQDPSIAKAFDNIADVFTPPTGANAAGFATARAKTAEAARLADMYAYAKDPNYTREQADRLGVGASQWRPDQSYWSVDQNNANALRQTGMNNATTLDKARIENEGALARQFANPIHVKEGEQVRLPNQTVAATGLPGMFGGNINVKPGEVTTTPDGQTFAGTPKPLTETEMRAAILGRLPDNEQRVSALHDVPVDAVKGPDGQPVNAFRADTVGRVPILDDAKTPKPVLGNYKAPGEKGITGQQVYDIATGKWKDTQTGDVVPAGSTGYSATLTGDKAGTGLGPTTANSTSATNRAAEVTRALNQLDLYEGLIKGHPGAVGWPGLIRGTAQNAVASAQDMASSFHKTVPEIQEATAALQNGLRKIVPDKFDPSIPEAEFHKHALAYALARTSNPSGEVSRQALEAALKQINGGGLFANSKSVQAGIDTFRKTLQGELSGITALRDPSSARTDVGYRDPSGAPAPAAAAPTGGVENWVRGPDGKLQRAQ